MAGDEKCEGIDWRLTADIDNTVLVANEVFTFSSLQAILDNIEKSPSLFLVSLNTVRDLLRGVSAIGQHEHISRRGITYKKWLA